MQRSIHVATTANVNGWTCRVRIEDDGVLVTQHKVSVTSADKERYGPRSTVDDLVTRSFEFLLEREPPTSILRAFALPDIERYFSDYPRAIAPSDQS